MTTSATLAAAAGSAPPSSSEPEEADGVEEVAPPASKASTSLDPSAKELRNGGCGGVGGWGARDRENVSGAARGLEANAKDWKAVGLVGKLGGSRSSFGSVARQERRTRGVRLKQGGDFGSKKACLCIERCVLGGFCGSRHSSFHGLRSSIFCSSILPQLGEQSLGLVDLMLLCRHGCLGMGGWQRGCATGRPGWLRIGSVEVEGIACWWCVEVVALCSVGASCFGKSRAGND